MTGLDKEKINQIIENASKGSKFYAKQKENQARSEYKNIYILLYYNRDRMCVCICIKKACNFDGIEGYFKDRVWSGQ